VLGDPMRAFGWASGIQLGDRGRHLVLKLEILVGASGGIAFSAAGEYMSSRIGASGARRRSARLSAAPPER
jgi:hypothetical protein